LAVAQRRRALHVADERVTALKLDVTSASKVEQAVKEVNGLDVLIKNAGVALYDGPNSSDVIEQHLAVNLFGTLKVLRHSQGAIVNRVRALWFQVPGS
jgi:NAD(P)-dependent dehydrogenase (short-subunit alcohol dehydrogenase family)